MPDKFSKAQRSKIMASIKSQKTKPELILKRSLRGKGFSYQPKIVGNPDFAHKEKKVAIFVHGCFWHGCPRHYKKPKSNSEYWVRKIANNIQRDKKNISFLKGVGFSVLTLWEHEILSNLNRCMRKVETSKNGKNFQ